MDGYILEAELTGLSDRLGVGRATGERRNQG